MNRMTLPGKSGHRDVSTGGIARHHDDTRAGPRKCDRCHLTNTGSRPGDDNRLALHMRLPFPARLARIRDEYRDR